MSSNSVVYRNNKGTTIRSMVYIHASNDFGYLMKGILKASHITKI